MTDPANPGPDALHPGIQRWMWEQGWQGLRPVQSMALGPLLGTDADVLITASTASGKTEAAFLPLLSRVATHPTEGARLIYVGPLKALVNDQFGRLEQLCERLGIDVCKWHGDVSDSAKKDWLENPRGVLLITPESLESLLVRRGPRLGGTFAGLDAFVVDELHAFVGEPRGRQLQSLMLRVERHRGARVRRVGLSATLGDLSIAACFLRPGEGEQVLRVEAPSQGSSVRLQLRGVVRHVASEGRDFVDDPAADQLFDVLRGGQHLVFANSRARVESLALALKERCLQAGLPDEFHAHHGSLSRDERESLEQDLKAGSRPATVVCTSTLEMGIDIGRVQSVAQVGPPPGVASLRQRLGRSGRRGDPPTLRLFVEHVQRPTPEPFDPLVLPLFQTVATVQLLLARWCEPPDDDATDPSTLTQQVLACIAEREGARAASLHDLLCVRGPFRAFTPTAFATLLRELGKHQLLEQAPDGTLMLGARGEKLVGRYDFYAAFAGSQPYRVVTEGRTLGTVEGRVDPAVQPFLVMAGRRWRVESVDHARRDVRVSPAPGGGVTAPGGTERPRVHGRIREAMRGLYTGTEDPGFLDAGARTLLAAGREEFARWKLGERWVVDAGDDAVLVPWLGSEAVDALCLLLTDRVPARLESDGFCIRAPRTHARALLDAVHACARTPLPEPSVLAAVVAPSMDGKFDAYVPEALLREAHVQGRMDLPSLRGWLAQFATTTA